MSAGPWWQAGQRLAILSALVDEQRGLIDHLEQPERIEHAGRIFWLGRLHGLAVVLTVSRIGKVSAAMTAATLIERFDAGAIVFTGVAGALADQVQLGPGHPAARGTDHPVGQGHHLRGGAVVALEAHHGRVRETTGEVQQVARRGPGERVDGLVGIADDGQIVAITEPRVEHPLLQRGDVLVLIDHETPVSVAELGGDGGVVLDRCGSMQKQIVEVQQSPAVAVGLEGFVAGIDGGHLLGIKWNVAADIGDGLGVALRGDQ